MNLRDIKHKLMGTGGGDMDSRRASRVVFLWLLFLIALLFAIPNLRVDGVGEKIAYSSAYDPTPEINVVTDVPDNALNDSVADSADSGSSVAEGDETRHDVNNTSGDAQSAQSSTSDDKESTVPATTDVMSGIVISEAQTVTYNRNEYQPDWNVGSGCNIRARILQSTSLIDYQTSNGCTVTYGSWYDPYTGQILTGNPYRGDGTENDLDIDHIIPLNYANSHGGYYWSSADKRSYGASLTAMNNGVYVAVSASENRKKGDKGPSQYYPPNPSYRCEYATKWRDLARLYNISLSSADYNVVRSTLIECGVD